jgi:phosphonate transport system substrate-binding protein
MNPLMITSCMAASMDGFCVDLAQYLSMLLASPVQAKLDLGWQERERLFDEGEIQVCWICGLPYVWKADQFKDRFELLSAPVMSGRRYQNCPIYFSDVVVRQDSPYFKLDDLSGKTWAINEPGSHSGYNVVRYALAARGKTGRFFGQVIESGSHQASLGKIINKEIDGSAIDSTVLELALKNDPSLAGKIKIIDTFGPSPIPPWIVSTQTPLELRNKLRDLLLRMDKDPSGEKMLARIGIDHFEEVDDHSYDPIREMDKIAEKIQFS